MGNVVDLQAALTAVWLNIWLVCYHNTSTAVIVCHVTLLEDFDILSFNIFFHPSTLASTVFFTETKGHS